MYVIIQLTKEREENNMIDNSEMFAELRNDLRNVIKEQTILMTDEELDIIIPIIQKFRAEKMAKAQIEQATQELEKKVHALVEYAGIAETKYILRKILREMPKESE